MDHEIQELEDQLKGLRPSAPDDACLERLLAGMEGCLQRTPVATIPVERALSELQPAALDAALTERLLGTVSRAEFPADEKVVPFPGTRLSGKVAPNRRPWFAAAAAVAVAGAFTALMIEGPHTPAAPAVAKRTAVTAAPPAKGPEGFVQASAGSGVQDAEDRGVMWTRDGRPVRMVQVIYQDRVKYLNGQGEIIEVERPRVEYLMVPEKID